MTMIDSVSLAREEARVLGRLEGREEGRAEGIEEGFERGISQGISQGERRYAQLASKLIALERIDDLKRASTNTRVRNKLYREFGL